VASASFVLSPSSIDEYPERKKCTLKETKRSRCCLAAARAAGKGGVKPRWCGMAGLPSLEMRATSSAKHAYIHSFID
jgi:hypothetical protein